MEVEVSIVVLLLLLSSATGRVDAYWCVARSDAADDALQSALDYACSAGADCAPLQPTGLCFLPNTFQAHSSYAFNSFYQRKSMAPGSCDFAGIATLAKTDPSYGSCVYPPNPSTAGLITTPATSSNATGPGTSITIPFGPVTPTTTTTTTTGGVNGLTPNFGPPIQTTMGNAASPCLHSSLASSLVFSFAVLVSLAA